MDTAVKVSTLRPLPIFVLLPLLPVAGPSGSQRAARLGTGIHRGQSPRTPRRAEWTWGQGDVMENNQPFYLDNKRKDIIGKLESLGCLGFKNICQII